MENQRKGILGLILWVALFCVGLTIYGVHKEKYEVVAAALAVVASCFSSAFAYEVIYQTKISQLPQILARFDTESRYQLLQLAIENIGTNAAFNVTFEWLSEYNGTAYGIPQNYNGKTVRISQDSKFDRIAFLPKGYNHYIWIDSTSNFHEKYEEVSFCLRVRYQNKMNDNNHRETIFPLSLAEGKDTLDYTEESTRTHYDLQKLPGKIDQIFNELRTIRQTYQSVINANKDN